VTDHTPFSLNIQANINNHIIIKIQIDWNKFRNIMSTYSPFNKNKKLRWYWQCLKNSNREYIRYSSNIYHHISSKKKFKQIYYSWNIKSLFCLNVGYGTSGNGLITQSTNKDTIISPTNLNLLLRSTKTTYTWPISNFSISQIELSVNKPNLF